MADRAEVMETQEGAALIKRCEISVSNVVAASEAVAAGAIGAFLNAADVALNELQVIAYEFSSDPFWSQVQNRVYGEELVSDFVLQVSREVLKVREAVTV